MTGRDEWIIIVIDKKHTANQRLDFLYKMN